MKRSLIAAVVFCAGASAASAEMVAYENIVWDDFSIPASLTGAPGNAAEGAKVVGSKSLGNCVACHEVSDLSDVPFHGEVGPLLDGAGDRWTAAELRGILVDAKMAFEESTMPSFYKTTGFIRLGDRYTGKAYPADTPVTPLLEAQQIEDVIAYLMTLQ